MTSCPGTACFLWLINANHFLLFQWDVSGHRAEYQTAFYNQEIASLPDGDPGGMTKSLPPWVTHRQFEKMHWAGGYVFLVLASLIASHTSGALSVDTEGNRTDNGNVTDGGFVPVVFTKVNQIIAREGSCALIDCNVTGEPVPSVQWFNSHGDRLDTETNGKTECTVTLNMVSCSLGHHYCTSISYYLMSSKCRPEAAFLFTMNKAYETSQFKWIKFPSASSVCDHIGHAQYFKTSRVSWVAVLKIWVGTYIKIVSHPSE